LIPIGLTTRTIEVAGLNTGRGYSRELPRLMLNPARIPLDVRGTTRTDLGLLAGVNERLRALRIAADEGKLILFADLLGGVLIIRGEVLPVGRGSDLVD